MEGPTTRPLVTVLMPVYNGGLYLNSAIESILRQTYYDFEFLIINDASTDDSLKTIQSFADPRIVVHTNPANMGQTKSLNVGLSLAKGKFIVINDADDLSMPSRIERLFSYITKHPECVVVGSSAYIMDRDGRVNRAFMKRTRPEEIDLSILHDTPVIHGSVIMNKEVIVKAGGYDDTFKICQDYALWSSLVRRGMKIANLNDILVVIRHYADSISFKEKDTQTQENGRIIQKNIESLTTLTVTSEDAVRQRLFFAFPQHLTEEEFCRADELVNKEYSHLSKSTIFSSESIHKHLKNILAKPYLKMVMYHNRNWQWKKAQATTFRYLRNYGFKPILFLLFVFLQGGGRGAVLAMGFYYQCQKFAAKAKYPMSLMKESK